MKIAVTGASGFIGAEVCRILVAQDHDVVKIEGAGGSRVDLNAPEFWRQQFSGARAVIHLAARAHVIRESASDPLAAFRHVNVEGTLAIANAAVRAGVRRIVFVSSIGVLGNSSGEDRFSEDTVPVPMEPYAVSKLEAEIALADLASREEIETVIVRPPLVYGPNVRGNFLRLLKLVHAGVPLPFGCVRNLRSFIGVSNLSGILAACATESSAAGRLFVVSDGEDISLPDLLRRMTRMMHRPSRILPIPLPILRVALTAMGRSQEFTKLSANLRVDSGRVRTVLGWRPVKNLDEGIEEMVRWYLHETRTRAV